MKRWITPVLLPMLALAVVACSADEDGNVTASDSATTSTTRPTLVVHPHNEGGATAALHGTLLAEGCVILRRGDDDAVAIFPDRSKLKEDGVELDGQLLRFNSSVVLGGGEVRNRPEFLERFGADGCGLDVGVIIGSLAD